MRLDRLQLLRVDEDLEVARVGEVDERGEKGDAADALVADRGHVAERRGEQSSADAIADRRDLALAGRLLDAFERGQNALAHIGLEALVGVALVRVDPGNDEHGQPLRDRPADERLLRIEVEDVELVDPGRHDQERAPVDLRRRGFVLDELDELVAEDHLARRRREIDAELETASVRLADAKVAFARLDVFGHHLEAAHEILAALLERHAQELGVGAEEVGRRERGGHLPEIELRLVALVRIHFVGPPDEIVRPARRQHIRLLDEIEVGIVAPLGVRESFVGAVGFGDGLSRRALEALQGRGPQIDELRAQRRLRLERPLGLGHVVFGDVAERADHLADVVGDGRFDLAGFARAHEGRQRPAGELHHAASVVGERFDVRRPTGGAG